MSYGCNNRDGFRQICPQRLSIIRLLLLLWVILVPMSLLMACHACSIEGKMSIFMSYGCNNRDGFRQICPQRLSIIHLLLLLWVILVPMSLLMACHACSIEGKMSTFMSYGCNNRDGFRQICPQRLSIIRLLLLLWVILVPMSLLMACHACSIEGKMSIFMSYGCNNRDGFRQICPQRLSIIRLLLLLWVILVPMSLLMACHACSIEGKMSTFMSYGCNNRDGFRQICPQRLSIIRLLLLLWVILVPMSLLMACHACSIEGKMSIFMSYGCNNRDGFRQICPQRLSIIRLLLLLWVILVPMSLLMACHACSIEGKMSTFMSYGCNNRDGFRQICPQRLSIIRLLLLLWVILVPMSLLMACHACSIEGKMSIFMSYGCNNRDGFRQICPQRLSIIHLLLLLWVILVPMSLLMACHACSIEGKMSTFMSYGCNNRDGFRQICPQRLSIIRLLLLLWVILVSMSLLMACHACSIAGKMSIFMSYGCNNRDGFRQICPQRLSIIHLLLLLWVILVPMSLLMACHACSIEGKMSTFMSYGCNNRDG